MKLIKVIKRFFLFVSALLLTLIVSVNYTNAQTAPLDEELINVEISVNLGNSSSPSFNFEGLFNNQGNLPSVMYLMYIPATSLIKILLKKLDDSLLSCKVTNNGKVVRSQAKASFWQFFVSIFPAYTFSASSLVFLLHPTPCVKAIYFSIKN